MGKIYTLILCLLFVLVPISSTAFAATNVSSNSCVVLIGDPLFKTSDYFEALEKNLLKSSKQSFDFGEQVQDTYENFWIDKGFLEEQPLTKQDLLDFVAYSGYDNVLFISISDPEVQRSHVNMLLTSHIEIRSLLEMKAYLVDGESILQTAKIKRGDNSKTSDHRATYGAFKICLKNLKKQLEL